MTNLILITSVRWRVDQSVVFSLALVGALAVPVVMEAIILSSIRFFQYEHYLCLVVTHCHKCLYGSVGNDSIVLSILVLFSLSSDEDYYY